MTSTREVSREFDAAEREAAHPEPLSGGPAVGGQQYVVEGPTPGEWLVTTYVVQEDDAR